MSFPPQFPDYPPLITFSSDIFHPLLTPLTTYTYTTSGSDNDTFSASDVDRLPPGGFSLRHGFPQWFRGPRSRNASSGSSTGNVGVGSDRNSAITVYEVLEYIRSSFTDDAFLDSLPPDVAANPGAYHAWRSYRTPRIHPSRAVSPQSNPSSKRSSGIENISGSLNAGADSVVATRGRRPGEWNWEGVWEERVKRGVQATLSEQALFGAVGAGTDIIRFSDLEPEALARIKADFIPKQPLVGSLPRSDMEMSTGQ